MVGETLLREKEVNINVYTEHYRHKRWRYHNELYEQLKSIHGENLDYKKFDNQFFIGEKGEKKDRPWKVICSLYERQ